MSDQYEVRVGRDSYIGYSDSLPVIIEVTQIKNGKPRRFRYLVMAEDTAMVFAS